MAKYLGDSYHRHQVMLARQAGIKRESDLTASWIVLISLGLAGLIVLACIMGLK